MILAGVCAIIQKEYQNKEERTMVEIARKNFASLWRDHDGYYIILHDGYFERDICADSDEDAIRKTGWYLTSTDF